MRSVLAVALAVAVTSPASGAPDLCRSAAADAAARHGVPVEMMQAITMAETGTTRDGRRGPWPWTLNIAGKGRWFDTRADAQRAAELAIASGASSTDIGCFQINWRWHGTHFSSIDQMLDPKIGADYAAKFLKGLHAEAGNWITAAGWYHSRTPEHAKRYRTVILRLLDQPPREDTALRADLPRASTEPRQPNHLTVQGAAAPPGGVRLSLLTRATGGLLQIGKR